MIIESGRSYEAASNGDAIPQSIREAWLRVDQRARSLQDTYRSLEADSDLTPEARQRRATEAYERERKKIESTRKDVRQGLLKAAESAERASIPVPKGGSITTSDPTKLVAAQNEAARIVRSCERKQNARGPFKQDAARLLRSEYQHGLQVGGVEGSAVCQGVLMASRELGIDVNQWLDGLRSDSDREFLDRARSLAYAADLISSSAPKPPRRLTQAARNQQIQRGLAPRFIPRGGPPIAAGGSSHTGRKRSSKKKTS